MNLSLHLVPGLFGDGSRRLAAGVLAGAGGVTVTGLIPGHARTTAGAPPGLDEISGWLQSCQVGEERGVRLEGRLKGRPGLEMQLVALGSQPQGRVLMGLELCSLSVSPAWNLKDLELALMGISCAALSGQSQGAAMIGCDLGPVGVGAVRGTVAEQTQAFLQILENRVHILITGPDTADSLGELPGYVRTPLADLFEFRLVPSFG